MRRETEDAKVEPLQGDIMKEEFGCHLGCMDGRVHEAVIAYMRKKYSIKWVDLITGPGINKILADNVDTNIIQWIKNNVAISVHKHGANIVVISGHPKCAGNPVEKQEQMEHLKAAYENVESFGFDVDIVLLWINEDWKTVEEIEYELAKSA